MKIKKKNKYGVIIKEIYENKNNNLLKSNLYNYLIKINEIFKFLIILILIIEIFKYNKILKKFDLILKENYLKIQFNLNTTFSKIIKNKIKIGIYTYSFKNGGTQRITSLLLKYIYKIQIFDIFIFSQKIKEDNEYYIPKNIKRTVIKDFKIHTLIRKTRKKRLHILIYQFPYADEIKILNNLKDLKIIFYQHYSLFYWIYFDYISFKYLYKNYQNSKYIISLIPLENDYLFKKWGINSILMDNFITYEYNYVIPSDLSSKNILMIGRGHDIIKRYDLGILALKHILKEVSNSKMIIIADLKGISDIKNFTQKLNYKNNINFIGYTSSPEIYFKNASLHIFPSISESFGLVLCETKIYGIPNILVGLDYVSIAKGGTIIVYDDKPETIAKESIKILKNDEYRKKLSKEARKSMKKYNNERLKIKWIKLILCVYNDDYNYYQMIRDENRQISKEEAIYLLKNQIKLLRMRKPDLRNMTLNQFENLKFL